MERAIKTSFFLLLRVFRSSVAISSGFTPRDIGLKSAVSKQKVQGNIVDNTNKLGVMNYKLWSLHFEPTMPLTHVSTWILLWPRPLSLCWEFLWRCGWWCWRLSHIPEPQPADTQRKPERHAWRQHLNNAEHDKYIQHIHWFITAAD